MRKRRFHFSAERNVNMRHRRETTDVIAKERLRFMIDAEPIECAPHLLVQMKQEIAEIIGRYFEMSPDMYEVKVVLKQNKKRA